MQLRLQLLVVIGVVHLAGAKFVLTPGPFMKLPGRQGNFDLNNGTATKASYDPLENLLYVVGHDADLLHIVNLTNPASPSLAATKLFSMAMMGKPDTVQVCRSGSNQYLAISFEAPTPTLTTHVHLYGLFDSSNINDGLTDVKPHSNVLGHDPRDIAWNADCTRLMVVTEGNPYELSSSFVDPQPKIDSLVPMASFNVHQTTISVSESAVTSGNVRRVFERCDGNSEASSSVAEDMQPKAVTIVDNDAFIVFRDNNAIGKIDLTSLQQTYHDLGLKDWAQYAFDGSYEDGGMKFESRRGVRSFYQPSDIIHFTLDGKAWLATADTGHFRQYDLPSCSFRESSDAMNWNEAFSGALSSSDRQKLEADMNDNAEIGRLEVSKLHTRYDGWNFIDQGYDYVCAYGGRGFSILNPDDLSRVYDSGDQLERYFESADSTGRERSHFNAKLGALNSTAASGFDQSSPELGPNPVALTNVPLNDSAQLLVIANGAVGGLYTYLVTAGATPADPPSVAFQSFVRRGQPGLSWEQAYQSSGDQVGEPQITDVLAFEDQGQKTVAVISNLAGAVSFYTVEEN